MPVPYLQRSLEPVLWRAARSHTVALVTGPRGCGKTALLRRVFGGTHSYLSLGRPEIRAAAVEDPQGFLAAHPPLVMLDDIHYAPGLLPHLRSRAEAHRARPGQFLLAGAADPELMVRVAETLGGRAAALRLLPLSQLEATGNPQGRLLWDRRPPFPSPPRFSAPEFWLRLLHGWYPEVVAHPPEDIASWQAEHMRVYLERDFSRLRHLEDPARFHQFLGALARQSGRPLNLSALARAAGTVVNTAKAWVSALRESGQLVLVSPYPGPTYRRMARTPKAYLSDTGTLCYLAGLYTPEQLASSPLARSVFETAVLMELVKTITHRGEEPRLFFWRTATGEGVDFVVQTRAGLTPITAQLSVRSSEQVIAGIRAFRRHFGDRAALGYVVHSGLTRAALTPHAVAVPF